MSTPDLPTDVDIPDPYVEEVSEGIFAYVQLDGSWGLNNAGFIVGDDGVTVIDTCFTERRAQAFVDAIRKVTNAPLRTLLNTHHHGDHTHGNYLLPQATIIAHELCRQTVLDTGIAATTNRLFPGVEWGDLKVAAPFVTFEDRLNVYVDDLRIEAIFVGPAHTTNDIVLWIPDRKLLFAGDVLFNGGTPFVVMGSVAGSLIALETIRNLGPEIVIPGHGEVCGPELIDDIVAYLRFIQQTATSSFEAGLTPLEAARQTKLGRFGAWHDSERLAANLHRAYSELRGEPLGGEINLASAIADMIEFNGGQPVRCLA